MIIKDISKAIMVASPLVTDWDKEHAIGLYLDAHNALKRATVVSMGSMVASVLHARELYRPAIDCASAGVILLHNHPTGDVRPSKEDIMVSRQMKKAGEVLDIPLLDSVIFAKDGRFYSLKGNKKF